MTRPIIALSLVLCVATPVVAAGASPELPAVSVTLQGSRESMIRQNRVATNLDLEFHRTRSDIVASAMRGELVRVEPNDDFHIIAAHPYALPETALFIERLGGEYRAACGEPLVVTSLARPSTRQPANASPLSVHPAGMAVDLRVAPWRECVSWLSDRLLELEAEGLIDATREYRPPHFHVAVFPEAYARYETAIAADSAAAAVVEAERRLAAAAGGEVDDAAQTGPQRRSVVGRVLRGVAWLLGLRPA
jgi:hypothetical protein